MHRLLAVALVVLGCGHAGGDPPPGAAARIITLTPSATEVVAALGATAQLVGVDDYSTFPAAVTRLPKIGSFLAPNLEAIVRLKPTLVIVDDIHSQAAGALRDAGVTTLECPMHALPDVKTALRTIGARIGKSSEAEAAVAAIDAALAATPRRTSPATSSAGARGDRSRGRRARQHRRGRARQLGRRAGRGGRRRQRARRGARAVSEDLGRGGAAHAARGDPRSLVRRARTVSARGSKVDVPAVKHQRVIVLADDFFAHPSPRVAEAVAALAKAIK